MNTSEEIRKSLFVAKVGLAVTAFALIVLWFGTAAHVPEADRIEKCYFNGGDATFDANLRFTGCIVRGKK